MENNKKNKSMPKGAIIALIIGGIMLFGCCLTPIAAIIGSTDSSTTETTTEAIAEATTEATEDVTDSEEHTEATTESQAEPIITIDEIPEYSGKIYVEINGNVPYFTDDELTTEAFESYSDLDSLGRCGTAYANICVDIMPTEERGEIGQVKPSGWHTVKYNGVVDGNYLYNRCHLIGYQLAGENANVKNLITGTRYMNTEGMLPFENKVANYVESKNNHVLYRVTPIFEGDNLLATGVLMEAKSVEDNGAGVQFNVFVYNVQPQIKIDYATGDSELIETSTQTAAAQNNTQQDTESASVTTEQATVANVATEIPTTEQSTTAPTPASNYIVNTNTGKFHYPSCSSVSDMNESNKMYYTGTRDELIQQGYSPCGRCHP